jgi:hypothetical protein
MPVRSLLTVPKPDPPKFTQLLSWCGVSSMHAPNQTPSPAKPASSMFKLPTSFFCLCPKLVRSQSLPSAWIVALDCPACTLVRRLPLSEFSSEERKPLFWPTALIEPRRSTGLVPQHQLRTSALPQPYPYHTIYSLFSTFFFFLLLSSFSLHPISLGHCQPLNILISTSTLVSHRK